jgi:pectin methylesterase-like acyl-CoA thioesterase
MKLVALFLFSVFAVPAGAALNATNFWPAKGATNVCPDTPLRLTFNGAPTVLAANKIRIYTSADALVDTIDLSTNDTAGAQMRPIAGVSYKTYPVMVSGNTATVYPHLGVLTTNQSYYVLVDAGVFTNASLGAFAGISDRTLWTFSTKPANPPANATNFVVAADGSGDFCTVQGAIDSLPDNNVTARTIFIRNGTYREINRITSKHNLKFRGENRKQTVIAYANNANFNSVSGTRYMFVVSANDIVFENLTLTNATPKGGSQAETIYVNGLRCILNNLDLCSYQDTFLCNGSGNQTYIYKSLVQGDTDFIWGSGTAMFVNSEIRALNAGHNCQMRTDISHYGAVFVDCQLTKVSGGTFTTHNLGRLSSSSGDPGTNGNAAYINCRMDTHISAAGWFENGWPTGNLRWWEYQSLNLAGTAPINTNSRAAYSKQLSTAEATPLRNPAIVFGTISGGVANGGGWIPQLSPCIIAHPTNRIVVAGQTATFGVTATGIPDPALQWQLNGTNLPGATNASLVITNAQAVSAGVYTCLVSNLAGTVASSNASLTVNPLTPPVLGSISWSNGLFRFAVSGPAALLYAVEASTNLLNWQTVFTTNSGSGSFNWQDALAAGFPARFYRVSVTSP